MPTRVTKEKFRIQFFMNILQDINIGTLSLQAGIILSQVDFDSSLF